VHSVPNNSEESVSRFTMMEDSEFVHCLNRHLWRSVSLSLTLIVPQYILAITSHSICLLYFIISHQLSSMGYVRISSLSFESVRFEPQQKYLTFTVIPTSTFICVFLH
jgi:hypothetical protein